MKYIPLTQNKQALADDTDYEHLMQWKWYFNCGYACRKTKHPDGRRGQIFMHTVVNKTPAGLLTDHINGNKLDNRRSNLRSVTRSQNRTNSTCNKNCKSGFKGVHMRKRYRSTYYEVDIVLHGGKRVFIGYFKDLNASVDAYRKAAKKYQGKYARV